MNELDRLLADAAKEGKKRFFIVWNRGLGDIALGLYALIHRIKTFIPDAQITFITRKELEEAFFLLDDISVMSAHWWQRGTDVHMEDTMKKLDIRKNDYDIFLEKVNPTKWLSWQIGKLTPKLRWDTKHDELWKRFNFPEGFLYIAVHINTETQQFYGYKKDWPINNWGLLLNMFSEKKDIKFILFGLNKSVSLNSPSSIDLRGETTLMEMLSIIKNCCKILIAPDGGVLSIIYYLDVLFPITIISLWGDSNQGIMKQAVPSPNKKLIHMPLIGNGKDISNITVDSVFDNINLAIHNKKSAR
ncbi:MAG: hypothetical protein HY755_01445 [Nitrospirae bacterium]|nr:hypothetical protein [Nitrospirota bacterium]